MECRVEEFRSDCGLQWWRGAKGSIFQHIIWSEERQFYFGMKEEKNRILKVAWIKALIYKWMCKF